MHSIHKSHTNVLTHTSGSAQLSYAIILCSHHKHLRSDEHALSTQRMNEYGNAWLKIEHFLVQAPFSCLYCSWYDFMWCCFLKGLFLVSVIPVLMVPSLSHSSSSFLLNLSVPFSSPSPLLSDLLFWGLNQIQQMTCPRPDNQLVGKDLSSYF